MSRVWRAIEGPPSRRTSSATSRKLSTTVSRNIASTISPKVTLRVRCSLRGSWTLPASACTISPPARGMTANVERLLSHCAGGRRLSAEVRIIAEIPKATAGAGPSRLIASTSATSEAFSRPMRIVTLSQCPASASASSTPTSASGCHSSVWDSDAAAPTAPASSRTSAIQKARFGSSRPRRSGARRVRAR